MRRAVRAFSKRFNPRSGVYLLLLAFLFLVSPPTTKPAEAGSKWCCPTGITGKYWNYDGFLTWYANSGAHIVANQHMGQFNTYYLTLTNVYSPAVSKPCGNSPACGPDVAHGGNATCNASVCTFGRRADCSPLNKQALAQLCNDSSFNKNSTSDVYVSLVCSSCYYPSYLASDQASWSSFYQSVFQSSTWAGTGCTVLEGAYCICNQGGSDCT